MSTTAIHYDTTVEYNCDIGFKFPDNETEKSRWCSALPQWIPTDEEWTSCESKCYGEREGERYINKERE